MGCLAASATSARNSHLRGLIANVISGPQLFRTNANCQLSPEVQAYVRVQAPKIVLMHVRVIDGTGAAPLDDRNVTIENGKIAAVDQGADLTSAGGTTALDLRGYSVMPGIVGMHNHMFYIERPNLRAQRHYEQPVMIPEMAFSSPRLYLAAGVTTMRTTGSIEPYTDVNVKNDIDAGKLVGPHIDVTGPYLEGGSSYFVQMPHLKSPDDARQLVQYWADHGVTSFKAYMNITRAELKAAVEAAHQRGMKVTGHLCSVTYKEAAEAGIDDLEHVPAMGGENGVHDRRDCEESEDRAGRPAHTDAPGTGPEQRAAERRERTDHEHR